jgi:Fe-S-cluster containining protein
MNFRECGPCTECCSGKLIGNSYGNEFGGGRKCIFLVEQKCTIYCTRPDSCQKYQCAWSQKLLSEKFRPDQCRVLVSVEMFDGRQGLKVVGKPDSELQKEIKEFQSKFLCEVVYV